MQLTTIYLLYQVLFHHKIQYLGKYNNPVTSHDSSSFMERLTIVQFVGLVAASPHNGRARDVLEPYSTFSYVG